MIEVRESDLARDAARGVERVVVDHRAAGLEHGEEADHVIGAVGQEQADPDAAAHAELLKAPGRAVDQPADLPVGRLAAEEIQAGPVRETRDRLVEHREQRLVGGLEIPRQAVGVVRFPGMGPGRGLAGRYGRRG
jgi:hypothetical protein